MNIFNPQYSLAFILLCPLVSAVVCALFFRKGRWAAPAISCVSAFLCMLVSLFAICNAKTVDFFLTKTQYDIFSLGSFSVPISFCFNDTAMNMMFVVSFVGFLIHIFSLGYMDDDKARGRFFTGLSFFMFSMTGIVLSGNLLMMFIFWEFVGFSSYSLIAHYSDTVVAMKASKKAFIANRVGDFGFLLGIIWCWYNFGTTSFDALGQILTADPSKAITGIGLLLMCGFLGKSAQFPLQVWLTDAMAGPTPVSALIHAATMVAAGIYMMAKLGLCGMLTNTVLDTVLVLATFMAFFAGIWALGQKDIKKTLAYSTLSHLGLMAMAIGLGCYGVAMLHLTMHAFFKAALFLCAGSIIHACHHEQDMFKMGGLFKRMPLTSLTAILATLSIIAIPFFAGYYSKDTIINAFYVRVLDSQNAFNLTFFVLAFLGVCLTSVYMGRLCLLTFFGKSRSQKAENARESSLFMVLPLLVLAVYSVAGAYGVAYGKFSLMPQNAIDFISKAYLQQRETFESLSQVHTFEWITLACTIVGLAVSYVLYGKGKDTLYEKTPWLYKQIEMHGYFDIVYDYYITKVQQRIAELLNILDLLLIEGLIVRGSAGILALIAYPVKKLYLAQCSANIWWILAGIALIFGILIY